MRNPWIQRLQRVSNSSPYFLCIVPLCSAYVGYLRNQNVTLNLGDIYGTPIANRVRLITFVVYAPKLRLWFNRTLWAVMCDYIYSTLCTLIHIYTCEVYNYICKCMCTYVFPSRVFLLASIVASLRRLCALHIFLEYLINLLDCNCSTHTMCSRI